MLANPNLFDTVLPLLMALVASSSAMTALWFLQRRTGNAGIVDVAWTALVGGQGLFFAAWPAGIPWLRAVAATMIAVWSLRLTTYLFRRVVGHPEEGRYAELRRRWGPAAQRKFFSFFQMQAVAAWLFAVPILAIARSPTPPAPWLVAIAIVTWATGIAGVAAADWQLARFKREPNAKAEVCRAGLWRYSRHPNYFFEWIHWLSYIPLAWASPWWWTPIAIAMGLLYLLLFVTGIPPTEAQSLASRGDKYREYQRQTSRFVPWPPRDS
jgi:steroid 5-alpha reductase family enzyme